MPGMDPYFQHVLQWCQDPDLRLCLRALYTLGKEYLDQVSFTPNVSERIRVAPRLPCLSVQVPPPKPTDIPIGRGLDQIAHKASGGNSRYTPAI